MTRNPTRQKSKRLAFAHWLAEQKKAERTGQAVNKPRSYRFNLRHNTGAPLRRSWSWWALGWLCRGTVLVCMLLGLSLSYTLLTMPALQPAATDGEAGMLILANDGIPIAGKARAARHVPINQLPPHLIDAVLATEDRRFYSHWGIDPWGLLRATFTNMTRGRTVQGGSTITQQLAKNLFLQPKRTFARKVEEILYALALEIRYSKDQILELYLNRVYFGAGAYGVVAASDTYFGRQPEALTLHQVALLAGLLKAPSKYAPTNSPALAKSRAGTVLDAMVDAGVVTAQEAKAARATSFELAVGRGLGADAGTGYASDWIAERLPHMVDAAAGKVSIQTTLDVILQTQAEAIVERELAAEGAKLGVTQAAVVVLDMNGAIRTMIGGRSYAASPFNRAVKALRQPGSAFKPFVYLAAIEAGLTAESKLFDRPVTVGNWTPRNHKHQYLGEVTARQALAQSINTVAVELYRMTGGRAVVDIAKRLGITSPLTQDASLALGTSEVSPLELAGAYLPIANGGIGRAPFLVNRIRDSKGKLLHSHKPPAATRIIAAHHAAALTDMLRTAVSHGTGKAATLAGIAVAGKTGTTQDSRDAWFVGYTDRYIAVVWVGNDDGKPMRNVTGGGMPARIWRGIMRAAHHANAPMARTAGLAPRKIDTGLTDWLQAPPR